jgi:hypothetical protein
MKREAPRMQRPVIFFLPGILLVLVIARPVDAAAVDDGQLEAWLQAAERELEQVPAAAANSMHMQIAIHRLDRRAARRMKGDGKALIRLKVDQRDKARTSAAIRRQQAGDDEGAVDLAGRVESDSSRQETLGALVVRWASMGRMGPVRACFGQITDAKTRTLVSEGIAEWLAFRGDLAEADVWVKGVDDATVREYYDTLRRAITLSTSLQSVAAALNEEKRGAPIITFADPGFDTKLRFCVRMHAREKAAAGDTAGALALIGACPAGEAQARGYLAVGDGQLRAGDKAGAAATAELARAQAEALSTDSVLRPGLLASIARLFCEADRLDAAHETARAAWAAEIAFDGSTAPNSIAREVVVEVLVQMDQPGRAATAAGSSQDATLVLASVKQFVCSGRAEKIEGFLETVNNPALRAAAWLMAAAEMTVREWLPVVSPVQ